MKWIPLVLASVLILASCNAGDNQSEETEEADITMEQVGKKPVGQTIIPGADTSAAVLELADDSYDFGVVKEG